MQDNLFGANIDSFTDMACALALAGLTESEIVKIINRRSELVGLSLCGETAIRADGVCNISVMKALGVSEFCKRGGLVSLAIDMMRDGFSEDATKTELMTVMYLTPGNGNSQGLEKYRASARQADIATTSSIKRAQEILPAEMQGVKINSEVEAVQIEWISNGILVRGKGADGAFCNYYRDTSQFISQSVGSRAIQFVKDKEPKVGDTCILYFGMSDEASE